MAYGKFTITELADRFGLRVIESEESLFADVSSVAISGLLRDNLAENSRLALDIGTEKARSEYIIAPILSEVRRQMQKKVSLFSGYQFDVDPARDLSGFCDFLISLSPLQLEIMAPVVSIVEAKKEDISRGVPQCLAELLAAQQFNREREKPIQTLYGAVTSGSEWKFLRLEGLEGTIDAAIYYLDSVEKIVGVLVSMLREAERENANRNEE